MAEMFGSLGPQTPMFVVGHPLTVIGVSRGDAATIIDLLQRQGNGHASSAAREIALSTRRHASGEVEFTIAEDEQMLAVLCIARLTRGLLGEALYRLEKALQASFKFDR